MPLSLVLRISVAGIACVFLFQGLAYLAGGVLPIASGIYRIVFSLPVLLVAAGSTYRLRAIIFAFGLASFLGFIRMGADLIAPYFGSKSTTFVDPSPVSVSVFVAYFIIYRVGVAYIRRKELSREAPVS